MHKEDGDDIELGECHGQAHSKNDTRCRREEKAKVVTQWMKSKSLYCSLMCYLPSDMTSVDDRVASLNVGRRR